MTDQKKDARVLDVRERVPVRGRVRVQAFDAQTGACVQESETQNVVTTTGLAVIADGLRGVGSGITHVATGSDDSAEAVSDTALGSEAFRDQVTQFSADGGGEITVRLFIGAASANGTVIKEAGLFNASSGGDLIARTTFDPADQVTKSSSITVQISWTIDIG